MIPHDELQFRAVAPAEAPAVKDMLSQALIFPRDQMDEWFEGYGPSSFRVITRAESILGGLGVIRMGQWFGGRAIPMGGVMMVGMAPEHRGAGAASFLLREMLRELHEEGIVLATLFASAMHFYRKAGFERAGNSMTVEVGVGGLDLGSRNLRVRAASADDLPELDRIHRKRAAMTSGNLDRHPYIWHRMMNPRGRTAHTYIVDQDGKGVGSTIFSQDRPLEPIHVLDFCATTREAAARLLAFFADHRGVVDTIQIRTGPQDLALQLLPVQRVKPLRYEDWMLRIVSFKAALEMRGYHAAARGEIHFDVADEVCPWNSGRFVLEVAEGRGQVRSGGEGRIKIGARGLASLFTGHSTAEQVAWLGLAEGDAAELARASAIFSGPCPWMSDRF